MIQGMVSAKQRFSAEKWNHLVPSGSTWNHFFETIPGKEYLMTVHKHLRFYPDREPEHQEILEWLAAQRGTNNENLIHLLSLGLSVERGEPSLSEAVDPSGCSAEALLPDIRKIVTSAVQNALRDAEFKLGKQEQRRDQEEETQAFLRDMAEHF